MFRSLLTWLGAGTALLTLFVAVGSGCDTGGDEGDRCNPLVERDECDEGLHCTAATCSESYCCPTDHSSTDPHCNGEGCPDPDAGEEDVADANSDAPAEASSDASDGSD